jgi:hypothetical protein
MRKRGRSRKRRKKRSIVEKLDYFDYRERVSYIKLLKKLERKKVFREYVV